MGYAGHKPKHGAKVLAMPDHQGSGWAPGPVAPVPATAMVLCPEGLNALKRLATAGGLDRRGAWVTLDGGFDSRATRKGLFQAGMSPNSTEPPRHRKRPKRGRKRLVNAALHPLRRRGERTFAWEDTFKRLWLRFERLQHRHYGMKVMA